MVYHELFRSSPIVCHQNLETWGSTDGESEYDSEDAEMDDAGKRNNPICIHKGCSRVILTASKT